MREDVRTMFVSYDSEADVATLGLGGPRRPGGPTHELASGTRLPALLRLAPDGGFDRLEVLGAARALPSVVQRLAGRPSGPPAVHEGSVEVPVRLAADGSSVRLALDLDAEHVTEGPEEFVVSEPATGSVVARLEKVPRGPVLALTLTLYRSGKLLDPLLEGAVDPG